MDSKISKINIWRNVHNIKTVCRIRPIWLTFVYTQLFYITWHTIKPKRPRISCSQLFSSLEKKLSLWSSYFQTSNDSSIKQIQRKDSKKQNKPILNLPLMCTIYSNSEGGIFFTSYLLSVDTLILSFLLRAPLRDVCYGPFSFPARRRSLPPILTCMTDEKAFFSPTVSSAL